MDKLIPQSTNSTSATHSNSNSNSNWDLGMDADYHRHCHNQHQTLHDHQLFHFSSIPTWPNYSPLPAQSPLMVQEPRTMKHTEALVEEDVIRSGELKEELLVIEEEDEVEEEEEELGAMKEMMYKIAAMQPVEIDPATIRKPKRRNVRISDDPQSVAARLRRERISEKIRILQRLVPGGTKLDTASMLDEAVRYVKFLKRQIRQLQHSTPAAASTGAPVGGGELPLCFSFNQP